MLLDGAVRVHVMQMAVVQVVDVVTVLDSGVLAIGSMNVVVIGVSVGH